MEDDNEAGKPLEGNGSIEKRKTNSGCGCLFIILLTVSTVYCTSDKSDFFLMPGETNLWTDAMEIVFDNLDQITPDSLEVYDDLNVMDHTDKYINSNNHVYGVAPFVRLRAIEAPERTYLMRVVGIVRHTGPNEFEIRSLELDTLVRIPPRIE